ncbi:MAG TPA: sigma 54-interacting transcriptional regulator [Candidatus Brocadiia bacterium]|nr:sigma 54-interacting transcriptional regulator [Candidatus Brocadiia bacterium]
MKVYAITTNSVDGACAAAAVLLKHPDAQVQITSQYSIGKALGKILDQNDQSPHLHICGVGLAGGEEDSRGIRADVAAKLSLIRQRGGNTVWYCGRNYMDIHRDALSRVCDTRFDARMKTNTACVLDALGISGHERARFLTELAGEYWDNSVESPDHQFWHDLVDVSRESYFGKGDREHAVRTIRKLSGTIEYTAEERQRDEAEIEEHERFGFHYALLGSSEQMARLRREIINVAQTDKHVLIVGPMGSGKEFVACALWKRGSRREKPFEKVNCVEFSCDSREAVIRLFGSRGGEEGAIEGVFEKAKDGTVFLRNVDELPLDVQNRLLLLVEEGSFRPDGTRERVETRARIIASTSRDLAVDERFRRDLYYRLGVVRIQVPSFRERIDSNPSDAWVVGDGILEEMEQNGLRLSERDCQAILEYDWPGSMAEYKCVLSHAAYSRRTVWEILRGAIAGSQTGRYREAMHAMSREHPVHETVCSAPPSTNLEPAEEMDSLADGAPEGPLSPIHCKEEVMTDNDIRKLYMKQVWEVCGRNYRDAARRLGVSENTLRKYVRMSQAT